MIALEQIRAAHAAGLPRGVVLMDAGYGGDTKLRTGISELGLSYVAGIQPNTSVSTPDTAPCGGGSSSACSVASIAPLSGVGVHHRLDQH